jgi:hypothetical protein
VQQCRPTHIGPVTDQQNAQVLNMSQFAHDNQQWKTVFDAVESLHQALQSQDLLLRPELARCYVDLQEALAVLGGDDLVARYWRARKELILRACADGQTQTAVPSTVRMAYHRQESKAD